jgi:phenylcoumaran benzylic ether reductase
MKFLEFILHLVLGNQRFLPSEFGNEVDRVSAALDPFQGLVENKKKIRRATEAAGLTFTYVSANSFAAYFVDYLLRPHEKSEEVTIYGNGKTKGMY